jgi:hypothetical protein
MIRKCLAVAFLLLLSVSVSFAGSTPDMQEGLWEITSKVEMQGMDLPAAIHRQCLKKTDPVPQGSQPGQECEIADVRVAGDTVSWSMLCSQPGGEIRGTGEITYHGDRFEGVMRIEMEGTEMISRMHGRRVGDCQ